MTSGIPLVELQYFLKCFHQKKILLQWSEVSIAEVHRSIIGNVFQLLWSFQMFMNIWNTFSKPNINEIWSFQILMLHFLISSQRSPMSWSRGRFIQNLFFVSNSDLKSNQAASSRLRQPKTNCCSIYNLIAMYVDIQGCVL